ncbi:MAG: metalloregulator ArsR/SmtB family transcription factor [Alphaproteobacteria bacterium]|nr:metalloregulator ArsR/SmtB family transcription factor [Alphaproteobacteria bacterium]MBU2271097.1 metalloregulator ArsR/SmtB family transcription factor [Alphaproteobacteria bacterium]MBU2417801.1 metalloregulator ArsR/SmtB family transcription factor [Alphaproteobacteria bacterium]
METETALFALAALSQATRLETFRLLVRHEPDGLPAGEIAHHLAVPANTMSAHLGVLSRAGLVASERRGRSIVYRADLDRLRGLVLFLLTDCCGGRADLCEPLLKDLAPTRA